MYNTKSNGPSMLPCGTHNTLFHSVNVTSDIPQGSILGPLLFVLNINDLSNCLTLTLPFIYADDTKCIKAVISTIDDTGAHILNYSPTNQNLPISAFGLNPLLLICQNIKSTVRLYLKLRKSRTLVLSYPRI